jgi:acyl-coenzyme A thioesterase PaaI-like protein
MAATPAELFAKLSRFPFGERLFTRAVIFKAPYFGSISPRFLELRPGLARVFVKNRRAVHNHIATVNAIALCAACELAAGTMIDSSLPRGLRWIPRGMTVRYLKKADTDIVATAELAAPIAEGFQGDSVVKARCRNTAGEVVMEADISMYVSPRK